MDTRIQLLQDAIGVTVCMTKGMYEDHIISDSESTCIEIQGQNSGRDDWILRGALELQKDIHVFYREKPGQGYDYLGMVEHGPSQVIQDHNGERGDLLQAVLFTTLGTNSIVNAGVSNCPSFKFKSAIFEHVGADHSRVSPACLLGCFHLIRE